MTLSYNLSQYRKEHVEKKELKRVSPVWKLLLVSLKDLQRGRQKTE